MAFPRATRTSRPNELKLTRAAGRIAVASGVMHIVVARGVPSVPKRIST